MIDSLGAWCLLRLDGLGTAVHSLKEGEIGLSENAELSEDLTGEFDRPETGSSDDSSMSDRKEIAIEARVLVSGCVLGEVGRAVTCMSAIHEHAGSSESGGGGADRCDGNLERDETLKAAVEQSLLRVIGKPNVTAGEDEEAHLGRNQLR